MIDPIVEVHLDFPVPVHWSSHCISEIFPPGWNRWTTDQLPCSLPGPGELPNFPFHLVVILS